MSRQDDFSQAVKEILARRVGHRCSNPGCRQPTSGPATSNSAKAINIGVAAHITAAAPNGPRYDATLASRERQSADNGLWCCQNCAKLIDNDPGGYSVELLFSWKLKSEKQALQEVETRITSTHSLVPKISWNCRQTLFSSHCLQLAFYITNEGSDIVREYAAKLSLPAEVAKYLRYHNEGDPVQSEILSFHGPILWDEAATYHVLSPWNNSQTAVIPRAKMLDHPLLPAGPPIPIAELDFGFSEGQNTFLAAIKPHLIEFEFWTGTLQKFVLQLFVEPDGSVRYRENSAPSLEKKQVDAKRFEKVLHELDNQLSAPDHTRAIVKSSQSIIDAVALHLQSQGWAPDKIMVWPAEDGDCTNGQYYLEVSNT